MNGCSTSFVDDFQWAVVRLATLNKRNEKGRLLFATVTLLSPDRSPPTKMVKIEKFPLGKSGITVVFRRTVLKAKDAVEWYRSLDNDEPKTPIPSRQEDFEEEYDGIASFSISTLIDDPLWPNLGLPMGEGLLSQPLGRSNPAPFIGSVPAKVHRRFGNAEGFEPLLTNDAALAFIARRLHINLKNYPEYLGSVALVVPDPIIKQIDSFLIPASEGRGERIFYRFVARSGKNLAGLKITMFDVQSYLLSNFETRDVPTDGILEIDKGSCVGTYGYIVTHPVHGVLVYHPPSGFVRMIHSTMNIVNQVRKVSVPISESSRSAQTEYSIHRTQRYSNSMIGDEPPPNVNVRVGTATKQREKAANAALYDQHWFGDGKREEAMAFVHERVSQARDSIMVADPYFGILQIPQYLLAITSDTVKIKILTSKLAFEGGCSPENSQESKATTRVRELKRFSNAIEQLKKEGNADVEVRVLLGNSPALHDRFLVVDDKIWFLGNSLNMLGERASMIIKLPNPDEVLDELKKMYEKQAKTFSDYYQQQINASVKSSKK